MAYDSLAGNFPTQDGIAIHYQRLSPPKAIYFYKITFLKAINLETVE